MTEVTMTEPVRQLNVRIPAGLHRRLKIAAARTGRSVAELVSEAVEQYLARLVE